MKPLTILLILSLIVSSCVPTAETPQPREAVPFEFEPATNNTITIASFNIQVFGPTKASKPEVMSVLAQIISQYDIVAIQEIRDASGEAIITLEAAVDSLGTDYTTIVGPRLGRTSSKEQYAFMYRTDTIGLIGDCTYQDPGDIFHREPYMAWFTTRNGNFDFVLINAHLDPDDVSVEFPAFADAATEAMYMFEGEPDIIILGDCNYDCDYQLESLKFPFQETEYIWAIPDSEDTNVAGSDCTYDRIIITRLETFGDYTGVAGVYKFDDVYGMTYDQAKAVSDHYPVWAEFYVDKDTR